MRPSERLDLHREAIRAIVAAHRATNPRVFGSVARGEDTEDSDIDILVDPVGMTLFDLGAILNELTALLGVEVDVLTPNALPDRFRARVLSDAAPI
jgi:predicted nucleotidyltransferase